MDMSAFNRIAQVSPGRQAERAAYADAVGKAANTQTYQQIANTALSDLQGINYRDPAGSGPAPGRPQLLAPRVPVKGADPEAEDTFTLLMASLIALLGAIDVDVLKSRMEMLKMAANASAAGHVALSEKYLAAVAALEGALAGAGVAKETLVAAKAALSSAQKQLQQAEQTLANTPTDSPEYAKALIARDTALMKVKGATQSVAKAEAACLAAIDNVTQASKIVEALATEVEETIAKPDAAVIDGMKRQLNAAATQVELMMKLAELMGKTAEDKLEHELEQFRTMQAARQEYLEKESEKYLEQVRKAEGASKTMGCIGKVLGGLMIVASIAGAAFTGGASLVLAGVGLALTAGDMIGKAITGVSIMEKATQPLMDKVLAPMIQAIGKSIGDALKKMGVDADTAEMAGNILGAIVGAVAAVAVLAVVVAVGKGAGARVAGSLSKMLGNAASKMVPDLLRHTARTASNSLVNMRSQLLKKVGLSADANSLAMFGSRVGMGMTAVQASGTTVQSAMGAISGNHQKQAAAHLSEAQMIQAVSELFKTLVEQLVQEFGEYMKSVDQYSKSGLAIQSARENTAHDIASRIGV